MEKKKILIVEDDEDNRQILVKVLQGDGYEVVEATDGRQALQLAHTQQPDLIIMDLALPVLDGWTATRQLKANAHISRIPVIALTAFAMAGDEQRAREAGCDHFLSKPCRPADLRKTVKKILAPQEES